MKIYADNAATTRMSQAAIDTMLDCMNNVYGNPSSLYTLGQKAKERLEETREEIAKIINAEPREIIFTSGGSEADNQAIISAANIGKKKGKTHIISTAFEHHAVLHTLKKLEKQGFEITLLPVHENGLRKSARFAEQGELFSTPTLFRRSDICLLTSRLSRLTCSPPPLTSSTGPRV